MDDQETLNRRARLRELIRECFNDADVELLNHIEKRTGKRPNQGELSAIQKADSGKSFGDKKARNLAEAIGLHRQWFDMPLGTNLTRDSWLLSPLSYVSAVSSGVRYDANVSLSITPQRIVPVISYIQAGQLTDVVESYAPGDGFAVEYCDNDIGSSSFALEIEGESMLPDFRPGDRIIVDPDISPGPGDFVVAKNSHEQATFKKYRPRRIGPDGNMIFDLIPLNPDFPTMSSDFEQLRIIGTVIEHRKKFRRK